MFPPTHTVTFVLAAMDTDRTPLSTVTVEWQGRMILSRPSRMTFFGVTSM